MRKALKHAFAPSKARMGSSDLLNYFNGKLLILTEFRKTLNIYMREYEQLDSQSRAFSLIKYDT